MINGPSVHKGQRLLTRLVSGRLSFEEETAQTKQVYPPPLKGKKGKDITNQSGWWSRLIGSSLAYVYEQVNNCG